MHFKKTFSLITFFLLSLSVLRAQSDGEAEKPLVTIACLSDIHAMNNMLTPESGLLSDITVRSSFIRTLQRMKAEEDIDIIILGGDCQSDKTISEANSMQVRRVINSLTRDAFADAGKPKNVLWVTGNHDYEVANYDTVPKPFVAGDFYRFPMKDDVGELPESELFYEEADNGSLGTQTLLAACHYRLCGLDFIVFNCGKNFWKSAWDYTYSPESAQWVKQKLDEIYADDPDRTVFFCVHVPFPDSNSMRASKGMTDGPAYHTLKQAFSEHPNLIMIYGHDHGGDAAFIREKTSQRITRYDVGGNVISTIDATHVDGPVVPLASQMYICSTHDDTYLGWGTYNLSTVATPTLCTITRNPGQETFSVTVGGTKPDGPSGRYILSSTGGRFSANESSLKTYLYKVEDTSENGYTLTRADVPEAGGRYVIIGQNAKNTGTYYALTNEHYMDTSDSQRLIGLQITRLTGGEPSTSFSMLKTTLARAVWEFRDGASASFDESFCIRSRQDGTYLGWGSHNISTTAEPAVCSIIRSSGADAYFVKLHGAVPVQDVGEYIFSSSGGRFSGNPATAKTYIYKVTAEEGGQVTLTRGITPEADGTYMFVTQNAKNNATYYALTNEHYGDGSSDQRLVGRQITTLGTDGLPAAELQFSESSIANCLWTLEDVSKAEGEGSFLSTFMGSMRYYYNSINTGDPTDLPTIVQALMVYVYPDRVVLSMKNYNQTGQFGTITVNDQLATYTSYRPVTLYDNPTNVLTGLNKVDSFRLTQPQVYDVSGRLCNPSEALRPGVYIRDGVKFIK